MTTSDRRSVIVLGASGSVGAALVDALVADGGFREIVLLVRSPRAAGQGGGVREVVVPEMTPLALERATADVASGLDGEVVGASALGVGAGTGKLSLEEHRAIDVELNAAFARGLASGGRVRHLAFMSAVGADPAASATGSGAAGGARYSRVKGEAEEAVRAAGPAVVSVFRPAMIIGSRHTPWLLEKALPLFSFLTPARFRSITVEQIARAMVATSRQPPAASAVYHFPEMIALGRAALSAA